MTLREMNGDDEEESGGVKELVDEETDGEGSSGDGNFVVIET